MITPGGNYGWPEVTGVADQDRFEDPIFVQQPPEASWSGMTLLDGSAIPQWDGQLLIAALRGERLWRLPVDRVRCGGPRPARSRGTRARGLCGGCRSGR